MSPTGRLNLSGRPRMPLVLQAETADCAYACIAMVCRWHGRHEDLVTLKQQFGVNSHGVNIAGIMEVSSRLGLSGRAIRCDPHELHTLSMPAILHWNFNHYVVLHKVARGRLHIHDPACGATVCSTEEAGRHFTGVAVELCPADEFEPATATRRPGLLHYLGGLNRMAGSLARIFSLSALLQLVALAMPFYLQLVVDQVLARHDDDLLTVLAAGFGGVVVFSVVTRAVRGWALIYLTNQLSFELGARMFHHLLRLPAGYFHQRRMGDIVSRFGSLRPIQEFFTSNAISVILDGCMATTTLSMLWIYSPRLASIVSIIVALSVGLRVAFYPSLRRRTLEHVNASARSDSNFMESVRSIETIKRYSMEQQRGGDWQNRLADTINANVRVGRLSLCLELLHSTLAGTCTIAVVYLGGREVLNGRMTIGMLYAFIAYRNHLGDAVASLIDTLARYLMLSLHLERLADITMTPAEALHAPAPRQAISGSIALVGAGFRYSALGPWIFRRVSFSIEAGESLAVIGPSGTGKSTLLNAMMQIIELDEGQLVIDSHVEHVTTARQFRLQCASVMQSDALLAGTIQSNIAFGDISPDVQAVRHAARAARIDADILRLPMGYQSPVGEMGANLSAGQVQRILIARALYRNPRILFLDEGTAHLDAETEYQLMASLLQLPMTCIFATHNKRLARIADKVAILGPSGCRLARPRQNVTPLHRSSHSQG